MIDETEMEAVHQTMSRLEVPLLPPLPDATTFFGYDPLPIALFFPGVRCASEATSGRRFVDLGCGIGTKLMLMLYLGWEVSGVEKHHPYAEVARRIVPDANIVEANILDVDEFPADLVYMYRPGVSEETETMLERHVVSRLSPGTVLFLPTRELGDTHGMDKIGQNVWKAV